MAEVIINIRHLNILLKYFKLGIIINIWVSIIRFASGQKASPLAKFWIQGLACVTGPIWVTGLRLSDWSPYERLVTSYLGRPSDWSPHVSDWSTSGFAPLERLISAWATGPIWVWAVYARDRTSYAYGISHPRDKQHRQLVPWVISLPGLTFTWATGPLATGPLATGLGLPESHTCEILGRHVTRAVLGIWGRRSIVC
jgi:hypothetical protein